MDYICKLKHLNVRKLNVMYTQLSQTYYPKIVEMYNYTYDIFSSNVNTLYSKVYNNENNENDNGQEMNIIVSSIESIDD